MEMATDCIGEELIERHSGNGESAERPKILAIEKACKRRRETGRQLVARLQLSANSNRS